MEDLIKRSKVIDAIHNYWKKMLETLPTTTSEYGEVYADTKEMDKILEHNRTLCNFIKAMPSADRPQGEWIEQEDDYHHYWECSECGMGVGLDDIRNFCPNCGADMRGEQDG